MMVSLNDRDMTTIPIEDAIKKTKEINPSYYELARILSR